MSNIALGKQALIEQISELDLSATYISKFCDLSEPTIRDFINGTKNTGIDHVSTIESAVNKIKNSLLVKILKGS